MIAFKWGFDMVGVNSVHSLALGSWGPDVVILMEEEDARPPEFYFSSVHLNDLRDEGQVHGRAIKLKTLFDGALILGHGHRFQPEPMREMWAMDRFSRRGSPDPDMSVSTFSSAVCAKPLTRTEAGAIENDFVDASVFAARTDRVVHDILVGLGTNGITWTSLYALTDTMKTNGLDEDGQAAAARVGKTEYKLFKHTANSFGSVGVAARHGHTTKAPPPVPMTIERGAEIMLAATRAFVKKRNARAVAAASIDRFTSELFDTPPAAAAAAPAARPVVERPIDDPALAAALPDRPSSGSVARLALAALAVAVPTVIGLALRRRRRRAD